jgi:hypothetical protein
MATMETSNIFSPWRESGSTQACCVCFLRPFRLLLFARKRKKKSV